MQNVEAKVADRDFAHDLEPLVAAWPAGYTTEAPANSQLRSSFEPDERRPACLERA